MRFLNLSLALSRTLCPQKQPHKLKSEGQTIEKLKAKEPKFIFSVPFFSSGRLGSPSARPTELMKPSHFYLRPQILWLALKFGFRPQKIPFLTTPLFFLISFLSLSWRKKYNVQLRQSFSLSVCVCVCLSLSSVSLSLLIHSVSAVKITLFISAFQTECFFQVLKLFGESVVQF